jgi:hypothetical protein
MAAPQAVEVHHAAPRCLLRLHDEATNGALDGEGLQAWLSWEEEASGWRIPVTIARAALEELVERSAVVLDQNKHRLIHESDWQHWGRRGGLTVLRRYGSDWFALLALRRWNRINAADLRAARPLR